MPGMTEALLLELIVSAGEAEEILFDEGVSVVSSLIFFTVLLFSEPFDDLIRLEVFSRWSRES